MTARKHVALVSGLRTDLAIPARGAVLVELAAPGEADPWSNFDPGFSDSKSRGTNLTKFTLTQWMMSWKTIGHVTVREA